jgi:flavodoxin
MVKKSLIIVYSYHHLNTLKIAKAFAKVLEAEVQNPQDVNLEEIKDYDLIGFGSGIYSHKHHESLLDLADRLPHVKNKKAFIFSTSGAPAFAFERGQIDEYVVKAYMPLRQKLESKGYFIVDKFICAGWNTNNFLKIFGGINKGRPNAEDLKKAERFAKSLIIHRQDS